MKKIIGIVAEYNPFHAGHAYHLREARKEAGEDGVVLCVMSGDFVQRGEWAILPKAERAADAVRGGADAVFELPLPWCLGAAQKFAEGAVRELMGLGITHLSFGSEAGETGPLLSAAETIAAPGFEEKVAALMKEEPNLSYPAARSRVCGDDTITSPNNLLAVEYLLALRGTDIIPHTVKRTGSGHDRSGGEGYPSASELRKLIWSGQTDLPHADPGVLSLAALSRLRRLTREDLIALPDCGDGLGSRIFDAVQNASSLTEVFDLAKTRRYTHSRVRRSVMCAVLDIRKEDQTGYPPYARLLAAGERGRRYLSEIRSASAVPVLTRPADIFRLSLKAQRVFAVGASAHDFYVLGYPSEKPGRCGEDYRTGPAIV